MQFRSFLFFFVLILFSSSLAFSQNCTIDLTVHGLTDTQTLLLGRFDFELPYKLDSFLLTPSDSVAHFSIAQEQLPTGLYFFYLPNQAPVDFIVNGDKKMEFSSHATAFSDSIKSTYSLENAPFFYQKNYKKSRETQIENIKMAIDMIGRATKDPSATEEHRKEVIDIYKDIEEFAQQQPAKYSGTFYAKYLAAKNFPKVPVEIVAARPDGSANPAYLNYFKAHFWDNYDFQAESLNRTPVFKEKLDVWLNLHEFNLDTLYGAIATVMTKAKPQAPLYKYALRTILTRYETAKAANTDAVFVHLFDTYYKNDKTLVDEAVWQRIEYKAELWRPTLLGKAAPAIELMDSANKPFSLAEMDGKLILLYFFSPQCAHCRDWTPKILELTKNYLPKGLTVVAVSTDGDKNYWQKYVQQNKLDETWVCLFDEQRPSKLEETYATANLPNVFFLNEKKEIIAKGIPMERMGEFLANWTKSVE